jgi:hypothetical protein
MLLSAYLPVSPRHKTLLSLEDISLSFSLFVFLSLPVFPTMSRDYHPKNLPRSIMVYGMDYIGVVGGRGSHGPGDRCRPQEYVRCTGKDMKTDRISVTDVGAGMQVFAPTDALTAYQNIKCFLAVCHC